MASSVPHEPEVRKMILAQNLRHGNEAAATQDVKNGMSNLAICEQPTDQQDGVETSGMELEAPPQHRMPQPRNKEPEEIIVNAILLMLMDTVTMLVQSLICSLCGN